MLGGFAPSAHALFGLHRSKAPRVQHKVKKERQPLCLPGGQKQKKNASPYAYLAPKKQKKPSRY